MENKFFKPTFSTFLSKGTNEMLSADNTGTKLVKGMVIIMKKIIVAILICSLLALCFASCGSSPSTPSSLTNEKSLKLVEYQNMYFTAPMQSTIASYSWENPTEIEPDSLIKFFGNKSGFCWLSTDAEYVSVPASLVEAYIQNYFDVDTDHLRKSTYYKPQLEVYEIEIPGGGPGITKVVDYANDDDILTLHYEFYSPADDTTVVLNGSIRLQIITPNIFKYISCEAAPLAIKD